jgi:hypothetical protein
MRHPFMALLAGLTFSMVGQAQAAIITLDMTEVPLQPIDGLTVTKGGLDFTFTDTLGGLSYDSGGPGTVTYVQDPSIQGAPDPFRIDLSVPVTSISFGLAELAATPLVGAMVTLSNGDAFLFDLLLVDPFPEGQFSWSGGPVTGFTLTPAAGAAALAFDNLVVETVPEPMSVALLGGGLLGLGLRRRRRHAS